MQLLSYHCRLRESKTCDLSPHKQSHILDERNTVVPNIPRRVTFNYMVSRLNEACVGIVKLGEESEINELEKLIKESDSDALVIRYKVIHRL